MALIRVNSCKSYQCFFTPMQAALFRRLREHYQKRDRLRLILDYRKKYLDSLVRGGEEEAKQAEENFAKARAQTDKDYEETASRIGQCRSCG